MNTSNRELHLLIPGLLGPFSNPETLSAPTIPNIERMLSRSLVDETAGVDLDSTLCALFGLMPPDSGDLPTGALAYLGDTGLQTDACWMHADPVHLLPDQDRLLVFDSHELGITQEEADLLAQQFNAHFQEEGACLVTPTPMRWYLRLEHELMIKTRLLPDVIGRHMGLFLAQGDDAKKWRSLLNETQMLFYHAEVNQAREESGKRPINGAWFSGIGHLSPISPTVFSQVVSDNPLAKGLAQQAGLNVMQEYSDDTPGSTLQLWGGLQRPVLNADSSTWQAELQKLEVYCAQLSEQLKKKKLDNLTIYPCNGQRYSLNRKQLRKFWKHSKSILFLLSQD